MKSGATKNPQKLILSRNVIRTLSSLLLLTGAQTVLFNIFMHADMGRDINELSSARRQDPEEHQRGQLEARRNCTDHRPPRRYFADLPGAWEGGGNKPVGFRLEPDVDADGYGAYEHVPARPWTESSLTPMDVHLPDAEHLVRETIRSRMEALLESDRRFAEGGWGGAPPRFLPPQFPQVDRSTLRHLGSNATTVLGFPPECCPANFVHQHMTKNFSEFNVLPDEVLRDCRCRAPRNYPAISAEGPDPRTPGGGPIATIVTAFYEMSSKHPPRMYERTATQLLATSDPMIIFVEPGTRWEKFFVEQRGHAPTLVVPLSAEKLVLRTIFPPETFWKEQHGIDPERPTHHKGINTLLYVIWDEKLVLLHNAAQLNPFNTTTFVWADAGYWRNPAPHLWRNSAVRINITSAGVRDGAVLLLRVQPYEYTEQNVADGNRVLVGGNCFAGTFYGVSNFYSAFYETLWAMAAGGKFVGSDQKVMYRTCHHYPSYCHIHRPRRHRQWLIMLREVLGGVGGTEPITEPMELHQVDPEGMLPVPPGGPIDNPTSNVIWGRAAAEDRTASAG